MSPSVSPPEDLDAVDYIGVTKSAYDALGYPTYRWAENEDPPAFVPPSVELADATVVVIASGGVYRVGDVGFTHKDDTSHREIPSDTPDDQLRVTHFAYDQTAARTDPSVVFPLQAVRSLVDDGVVGALADVALTFMGGIYSQRRLHEELVPALVQRTNELGADVALLVPV